MTKLGETLAAQPATPAAKASRFMAALTSSRVLEPITIPQLGITALMTVVGAEPLLAIEADLARSMKQRGLEAGILNEGVWELERALRTLSQAVLDDSDPAHPPLGTLAEWGQVPKEIIADLWRMYADLCERHDPGEVALDEETIAALRDAVQKKNAPLLRSFGVRRLAAFLTTTDVQLSSSTTRGSSPGDSSPES